MAFLWFLMLIFTAALLIVLMLGWQVFHFLFGGRSSHRQESKNEADAQVAADHRRLQNIKRQFKRMGEDVPYEDVHFEN